MDRSAAPRELRPFLDESSRLFRWPSRQKVQRLALASLAKRFEPGREYAEHDVNMLLMEWHTFGDWAMLRRMLIDWKFLEREPDGSRYRLRSTLPEAASADSGGKG